MKNTGCFFLIIALLLSCSANALAQRVKRARPGDAVRIEQRELPESLDSLQLARLDSLKAARDSIAHTDSLHRADSLLMLEKSSLKFPAFSSAGDSIIESFKDGRRIAYYYGGVSVKYEDMELTANYMEYDMATGTVFAKGQFDTITREWVGLPEMKQGGSTFKMDSLKYNFKTKKAFISNMLTNDNEGDLQGRQILMLEDKSINISGGRYTVCDAEEPHYYLALKEAKVITQPRRKTVFGPAHPVVGGVDLPIFLPYGFVPERPEKSSGILFPNIGEEMARGFYAQDGGVYLVFGDNFDVALTGSLYTLGSWSVSGNGHYNFRYKCSGNFGITYSNDREGERGSPDYRESTNFSVKWSHQQDSKSHPGTTFSASVNFSSPKSNRYNSRSLQDAIQNQTSSSISYSRNWNGKFNLSVTASHSQSTRDTANASYTIGLPNVNFSMTTIYPFKRKTRTGPEKFYEKISFGYNNSFRNTASFLSQDFRQGGIQAVLDTMQSGMAHNFSLGLPSFQLFKYITFNPSLSYGMNWFFNETEQYYDSESGRICKRPSKNFSRFGITQRYSFGMSMSTRLYGMFNFGKHKKVQAIRHVITPSINFSLAPELGTYANGWRTLEYDDPNGVHHSYDYNVFSSPAGGPPGKGRTGSMSLQIGNNLEAKIRDLNDTTGTGTKKVKLLDQLNLNTGYNFFADSCKMSNISVNASTSILDGKMHIQGSMSLDPYAIDASGRRCGTYNVAATGKLVRLTNATASLSYSFSGKGTINGNDGSKLANGGSSGTGGNAGATEYYKVYYHPVTGEYIPGGWLYYTNPHSPWSLSLNYVFNYSKSYTAAGGQLVTNNNFTQTLGINGNIQITPKMALNFNTGFDLMKMKLSPTNLSFTYDLHCFSISFNWIPSGTYQSYSFRIAAKAAALADLLKLEKSSSYFDR